MKVHGNARLLPRQRTAMCERVRLEGWSIAEAAEAFDVSERTVFRWLVRFDAGESMLDRSSAPHHVANRTPDRVVELIERLRRLRWTCTRIAAELEMATSTVCAVLDRLGLNRRSRLEPIEPPNRYCRRHPGELVHVDTKSLGRFHRPGHRVTGNRRQRSHHAGWDVVHICIDDCSRLAYVEVLDDEHPHTTVAFFERAVAWFAERGVQVREVISDNGNPYVSRAWASWCAHRHIKHRRIRAGRPQTNGKAERLVQTLLREWAYAAVYRNSAHRTRALQPWLDYYNHRRPHSALGHKPPISKLA
jgi:transposase InsO family protein